MATKQFKRVTAAHVVPKSAGPVPVGRRVRSAIAFSARVVRQTWTLANEDNLLFLASGIAFNILLAIVPFVLLLVAGLTVVLGMSPDATTAEITALVDRLLPAHSESEAQPVHSLVSEIVRTRGAAGFYGALIYIWFSTRLFGSLRTVLAMVFDRVVDRGVLSGKWFDVRFTIYTSILLLSYVAVSVYLALGRRSTTVLQTLGLREDVMGRVEYMVGRLVAFAFVAALFWALYFFLPKHKISMRQALAGALASSLLFEVARNVWSVITTSFAPASLYSGTLYITVTVVFWVYYGAILFILGAELSQAYVVLRRREAELNPQ